MSEPLTLDELCRTVDAYPDAIGAIRDDFDALATHVRATPGSNRTIHEFQTQLRNRIAATFPSGHNTIWKLCRDMQKEMIFSHVVDGKPLEPYFSVIYALREAARNRVDDSGNTSGDWVTAVHLAVDHARLDPPEVAGMHARGYQREFVVAQAAKRLQADGYTLQRDGANVSLDEMSEAKLVERLERLVARMGGIEVAAQIFATIAPLYDAEQERYQLVLHTSSTGDAQPAIPFGYLLQLAAKQVSQLVDPSGASWQRLIRLSTDYAALLDVQSYTPSIYRQMDAKSLLPFLQETALSDTLFRLPQVRGSDVARILAAVLKDLDHERRYGKGWTINEVLLITRALLEHTKDMRGPVILEMKTIIDLSSVEAGLVGIVLEEVLCHPELGPNRGFAKPTDAPRSDLPRDERGGHDLNFRPLLMLSGGRYLMLDRALSSLAFVEALLGALRPYHGKLDEMLGTPIERFVEAELNSRGIPAFRGDYVVDGEAGECDLVIETEKTVFFLEFKKKALTREGQAGIDASLLVDLANSLLQAQVQAGWHEVRLRRKGFLDLVCDGVTRRIELLDRNVERLALSFLDFGSFQDRVLTQQFLAANLGAKYTVNAPALQKKFKTFNEYLDELTTQTTELLGPQLKTLPFFNCWFLSVPQLLIFLDDVRDTQTFRGVFFSIRGIASDVADLYFTHGYWRKARAQALAAADRK